MIFIINDSWVRLIQCPNCKQGVGTTKRSESGGYSSRHWIGGSHEGAQTGGWKCDAVGEYPVGRLPWA